MLKRKFVLIGAPDDRGVAVVGGRVGAKEGPAAIRRELKKMKVGCLDEGDIEVETTQDETYQTLREQILALHRKNFFPILLGGGHDLSFGSLSGFLDAYPDGGIVNIDPHLDVRPILKPGEISSGSAYRLLLESGRFEGKNLMEFGYQAPCNAPANVDFLREKGTQLVSWPADVATLKVFAESHLALAVSFDLDSIQSAFAPGVSAPAKIGYTSDEALEIIRVIKGFPHLKHFEIMEMNPRFDPDRRTAKLAARLLYEIFTS